MRVFLMSDSSQSASLKADNIHTNPIPKSWLITISVKKSRQYLPHWLWMTHYFISFSKTQSSLRFSSFLMLSALCINVLEFYFWNHRILKYMRVQYKKAGKIHRTGFQWRTKCFPFLQLNALYCSHANMDVRPEHPSSNSNNLRK